MRVFHMKFSGGILSEFFPPRPHKFWEKRQIYFQKAGNTGRKGVVFIMLDRTSLIITIIGAINWLMVGLFKFDLVAYLCGGQTAVVSRVIYTLVGLAALWCISLLFKRDCCPDE